jgi:hypothetical protein
MVSSILQELHHSREGSLLSAWKNLTDALSFCGSSGVRASVTSTAALIGT